MRKTAAICFFSIVLLALCVLPAPARAQGTTAREPDSEYVEKKPAPKPRGGGGLFDFLPFVGSRPRKVEPEKLEPAPPPEAATNRARGTHPTPGFALPRQEDRPSPTRQNPTSPRPCAS